LQFNYDKQIKINPAFLIRKPSNLNKKSVERGFCTGRPATDTELFSLCDQSMITEQTEVRRSEGEYNEWTAAGKVDGLLFYTIATSPVFIRDLDREAIEGL